MLNLAVLLETTARDQPERTAVVLGDTRLTYAQVDAEARRVAAALAARGIGRGDRVALSCPNLPLFPVVYYGILKAGATVVPLNVLLTEREIAYHLTDSGARAYFCFEGTEQLPMAEAGRAAFASSPACEYFVLLTAGTADPTECGEATLADFTRGLPAEFDTVRTDETDTAVVLYTSGTTGRPKGAELTHSNMVQNALVGTRICDADPYDVHLVALPLFHAFGQTVQLNAGFASGATLVLMSRFDAATVLELMERELVSVFAGVPTMFWALLTCESAERFDLAAIAAALRLCICGGSALPIEVLKGFEERFGVPILEGYGLSETSPLVSFNRIGLPRKVGSIGLPVWGVEVRVTRSDGTEADVDEPGELQVRGHNVMRGYLHHPEATAEAIDPHGWFRTGDIGRRDADGYLSIIDRTKDLIIRGGFNVYPREVEEVLHTHPGISLAAVVGVPHPSHGEEVKAYVVRRPGATVTEQEIVAWSRRNLAGHKYPRLVEFRPSLPTTATGKILKRDLAVD
ncbi:long-chain fatty acid--CoA ligase [Kitasatospora sp. NPDC058190]|uniref:long-chain-fatty-acid--CoA ligase n=1 Tax=Kitasatospora sp. NPDC058190 TaxID=3346371 RepID=UPI0036DB9C61